MNPQEAVRSVLAAFAAFVIVYVLFALLLGGTAEVGSNGQYVFVGLAALLSPLAGAGIGAWQARAAGVGRPLYGVLVPTVVALLLGLLIFATNETTSDSFNTLQPLLVLVGTIAGAAVYGVRWFGTTSAR